MRKSAGSPRPRASKRILDELSLTAKSVVFVDDHPVERAAVKAALPEIRVIGSNPFLTKRVLLWSAETKLSARNVEFANREQMLKKQFEREKEKSVMSRDEFLNSLDLSVDLWEVEAGSHPSFSRVFELVNKTNSIQRPTVVGGISIIIESILREEVGFSRFL